jgi:uncharacterized protein (TIGR02466 family)
LHIEDNRIEIEKNLITGTWADNIASTFDTEKNLIEAFGLSNLKQLILDSAKELTSKSLILKESWVNYSAMHNYQEYHKHGYVGISGVYYLKTNEQDGRLRFHTLLPSFEDTDNFVYYQPQEGKIILFPSWAPHSVETNKTDSVRVSISFNLYTE